MGFMDKLKDTFTTADDEMEVELDETEAKALSDYEEPQNKGVQRLSGNTKMVLFEPRSFEEAEEVGRHLKEKRAAVINLHRLPREYAQRTIDFLTGVVFIKSSLCPWERFHFCPLDQIRESKANSSRTRRNNTQPLACRFQGNRMVLREEA